MKRLIEEAKDLYEELEGPPLVVVCTVLMAVVAAAYGCALILLYEIARLVS